jgi:anaerobic ribonucleoside-triphosphate reductase
MEAVMAEGHVTQIRKRDGNIVPFDQTKITNAIFKAAQSVGGDDYDRAVFISNDVVALIEERYGGTTRVPSVEEIQDLVERSLIKHGHAKTAKAYILYRERRQRADRGLSRPPRLARQ